jgi:hypothetical protein
VDLDDLARRLESAVADRSRVAEVGPFTWHDRTADDPRRVTLERASVAAPESLSFTLRRPTDYDTEVTVCAAGWIDVLLGDDCGQDGSGPVDDGVLVVAGSSELGDTP